MFENIHNNAVRKGTHYMIVHYRNVPGFENLGHRSLLYQESNLTRFNNF